MQSIFVDTSGWYASIVRKDHDHKAAKQFLTNNKLPLITSDYGNLYDKSKVRGKLYARIKPR